MALLKGGTDAVDSSRLKTGPGVFASCGGVDLGRQAGAWQADNRATIRIGIAP